MTAETNRPWRAKFAEAAEKAGDDGFGYANRQDLLDLVEPWSSQHGVGSDEPLIAWGRLRIYFIVDDYEYGSWVESVPRSPWA